MNEIFDEINRVLDIFKGVVSGDVNCRTMHDELAALSLPMEKYESSFLNPEKAKEMLGESGGVLSALYADIISLAPFAAEKNETVLNAYYGLVEKMEAAALEDAGANELRSIFKGFYFDNLYILAEDSIRKKLDINESYVKDIIEKSDLFSEDYLYEYGLLIGENEKRMREYLASLSQDMIDSMAHTLTNAYKKGFEVTGKDITIKNIVDLEFPIGMERVARVMGNDFRDMGLEPTYAIRGTLSINGRGDEKRGVYSNTFNPQFEFDHKNDMGFYLDMDFAKKRLSCIEESYTKYKDEAGRYGGPAVVECFGQESFVPVVKKDNCEYSKQQHEALLYYSSNAGNLVNRFIPGEERSFSVIAYPLPTIGKDFEKIFEETVKINTLDYELYRDVQQKLIDALDKGSFVIVKGRGENKTDMKVMLQHLNDPEKETGFENCVADVNIPVGEVFTSPKLEGTNGVLNVSEVFLGVYSFKNLTLHFKDGVVTDYSCDNFKEPSQNKKLIMESILDHHEWLPIGEFAIGTNTTAFTMARKYNIAPKLPILIAEKTGPHFAVGDTCYPFEEDVKTYNPDGKEIIAKSNSFADKRKTKPDEAYFNCHTDITIPYDELSEITVVSSDGTRNVLIKDGRFVLPGTEVLNEGLEI